jgi:peroxiredoxin Q/BCP
LNAYRDQYAQLFRNGRDVVLIVVSVDADTTLAAWAREREYPFLLASDSGAAIGRLYGSAVPGRVMDARNVFVIGPDGRIAHRILPFREVDPAAYTELAEAIEGMVPRDSTR